MRLLPSNPPQILSNSSILQLCCQHIEKPDPYAMSEMQFFCFRVKTNKNPRLLKASHKVIFLNSVVLINSRQLKLI